MTDVAPAEAEKVGRLSFGIAPPNWGAFGDPSAAAELAGVAEEAGWDGYFCWDALPVRPEPPAVYDPWVILSAVAMATTRMRIGSCIAVVPRYPPHVLARTLVSLDVLSNGRLILGVGIGDGGASSEAFGDAGEARVRAEKLDEALDVITRLWSGEEVNHRGQHFVVEGFTLAARPVQRPRIPIWVGGDSPPALRRAARWDGWIGPDNAWDEATVEKLGQVHDRLAAAGADPGVQLAY
ncbi:MAG: LLM class flavin-dependent oxidoreductase, partial [Actinobacteria bacterium]|nr:LLM class flavin-dependent oxidoreductase [Actinomycetota bacterium]